MAGRLAVSDELVPFLFQGHVIVHVEGERDTFVLYGEDELGVYVVAEVMV